MALATTVKKFEEHPNAPQRGGRHILLIALIVVAASALGLAFLAWRFASSVCMRSTVEIVEGPSGSTVVTEAVDCDTLGKDETLYVYVAPRGQAPQKVDLIFQYDGPAPALAWLDARHLRITVRGVTSADIVVRKDRLRDVSIDYDMELAPASRAPGPTT